MSMLKHYISPHAKAVKAYLESYDGIEPSWDSERKDYRADVYIAEWWNCREKGYVITLRNSAGKQINIAFFEHRNNDCICAVKWIQDTLNPPTIDNAEFGDAYSDKWDVSHSFKYNQAYNMAEWIYKQLEDHWMDGEPE